MSQSSKQTPLQQTQRIDPNAVITRHAIKDGEEYMLLRFQIPHPKEDGSDWGNIYRNGQFAGSGPYKVELEIWNLEHGN